MIFKYRFLLLLMLLAALPTGLLATDYIVIVNKDNPVSTLDEATVRKIFLGKKNFWDDGHRIEVYLQEENNLHNKFTAEVLKKSTRQFKMYWRRALYSGTGLPPQKRADDQSIKMEIAADSRAIGYINSGSLDDSVKKIQIDNSTLAEEQ